MTNEKEGRKHNSTYTQVGVQCIYVSEVLNPSSVLLMKFSAKNPHLRVATNLDGQIINSDLIQVAILSDRQKVETRKQL